MKKIYICFFLAIILFFSRFYYEVAGVSVQSKKVNAVLYGKSFGGINVYKVSGNTYYFSVKELAKLYNAILEWKSVSRKITMRLGNRKIDIKANSPEVVFGRKIKRFSLPSILIKNDMYIPPEVITSKEFATISNVHTSWNSSSLALNVTRTAINSRVKSSSKVKEKPYSLANKNLSDLDLINPEKFGQSQISELNKLDKNDNKNKDLKDSIATKVKNEGIINKSFTTADDSYNIMGSGKIEKRKFLHKRVIVIDAGHGGKDPGAIGANGTKEKDLNLDIARKLKSIFEKDRNFKVVLTRESDIFIPLVERSNIANKHKADLFISIHCNANINVNKCGFEIYFLSEKATSPMAAATAVLENSVLKLEGKSTKERTKLQSVLWSMTVNEYINESSEVSAFICYQVNRRLKIPIRGVKQANFYVLRGSHMPSVLVESAFLSNYGEESKLNTNSFRKSLAYSIYEGVLRYYAKKEMYQSSKQ
jgi:N-acetylmuramoyl-L-alanine amidase